MMGFWHTLAYSEIGTLKLRHKEKMGKEETIELGKTYCNKNNITYAGTFSGEDIGIEEVNLRLKLY